MNNSLSLLYLINSSVILNVFHRKLHGDFTCTGLTQSSLIAYAISTRISHCKFRNFRKNFFMNNVKRHICEIKNSHMEHNLPTSENGRVISLFHEDFNFANYVKKVFAIK